jgi:hypothetical protein
LPKEEKEQGGERVVSKMGRTSMIEVLRLALKALNAGEHAHLIMNTDGIKDKVRQAIAGLESQEPVALETVYETIIQWDEGGGKRSRRDLARRIIDLYTHPPQRTWVGLTKDEVDSWNLPDHPTVFEFAQFIEAKLKEKNND